MLNRERKYKKVIISLVDLYVVHFGIILTFLLKFNGNIPERNLNAYKGIFIWICIAQIIIFLTYDMYTFYNKKMEDYISSIFIALVSLHIVIMALSFFSREFAFPRSVLLISYFVNLVFMYIWRYVIYRIYIRYYGKKVSMVIGNYEDAEKLAVKMIDEYSQWHDVRYIISSNNVSEIKKRIKDVDVIYLMEEKRNENINEIIIEALNKNKKFFIVPSLGDILLSGNSMGSIGDVITFNISKFYLNYEENLIKRIMDILISFIGIILTFPVMLLTALLIKLTSKGPILYKQTRVTKGRKEFEIYKFRTMTVDAEKKSGPMISTEGDCRITALGGFLRKVRIDELPQFFNVLKGDMSIVGPRPERPFFVDKFAEENKDYLLRFRVKAGITGLAQVKGKYNTDVWDKLRMDLIYIKNYSLLLDIKIIFLTLKTMILKSSTEGVAEKKSLSDLVNKRKNNITILKENGVIYE